MLFILIRSPNKAPPVFFFDGSTEITATALLGYAYKNLRTNSSVNEDFPAPPVPVIPNTGMKITGCAISWFTPLSANVICLAIFLTSLNSPQVIAPSTRISSSSEKSHFRITSSIIPSNPSFLPSSGEYIFVIPY